MEDLESEFYSFICLCIGRAGSSWLLAAISSCGWGLLSSCAGLLTALVSLTAEQGL